MSPRERMQRGQACYEAWRVRMIDIGCNIVDGADLRCVAYSDLSLLERLAWEGAAVAATELVYQPTESEDRWRERQHDSDPGPL